MSKETIQRYSMVYTERSQLSEGNNAVQGMLRPSDMSIMRSGK